MALLPLPRVQVAASHSGCRRSTTLRLKVTGPSCQCANSRQSSRNSTYTNKVLARAAASKMGEWSQWETVLQQTSCLDSSDNSQIAEIAAITPTPHPVAASSVEGSEWEAVLLAAEGAAPHSQQKPAQEPIYAVIECGSHSTRLLISTERRELVRMTLDTQLGAKTTSSNSSAAAPLAKQTHPSAAPQPDSTHAATLSALRHYRMILDQHDITALTAVATAAVREAADADSLIAAASSILGTPLEVLSGVEEGRYAFIGATTSLAPSGCTCLVVDLGGRSTELAVGVAGQVPQHVCSIPLGCLAVQAATEQAAAASCDQSDQHTACRQMPDQQQDKQLLLQSAQQLLSTHAESLHSVTAAFRTARQQAEQQGQQKSHSDVTKGVVQQQEGAAGEAAVAYWPRVLTTGGTVTTLAALLQQLPEYSREAVHVSSLTQTDIKETMQQLQDDSCRCRLLTGYPWLTEARLNSLAPGCAAVLAVMQCLAVEEVTVSDSDLLDAVLTRMITQKLSKPT